MSLQAIDAKDMVVGGTYRFRAERLLDEYGEWTVTRIDGNVYAVGKYAGGREVAMVHSLDTSTGGSYDIIPVAVGPDRIAEMFS